MVVFIHSVNISDKIVSGNIILEKGYSSFIQTFISDGICLIAVPLFFAISGYLFFFNLEGTLDEFLSKYKKRLKTLLVPYLFWSIGILLFFFVLQLVPQTISLFSNRLISDYSSRELLRTIFLEPIPYQLWFLRDLMILVLVSPIILWLIKYLRVVALLIFGITWYINFDYIIFSNEALLFYFFGAAFGISKKKLLQIDFSKHSLIYISFWLLIVLIRTLLIHIEFQNILILNAFKCTGILTGIVAIWSLYDYMLKDKDLSKYKFYGFLSFSFFIYAFHLTVINIIKKGGFNLFGKEELASLIIYITAPLLTIGLSIIVGYYLKRFVPKFYGLITGGR